jgi:hypothetical protein
LFIGQVRVAIERDEQVKDCILSKSKTFTRKMAQGIDALNDRLPLRLTQPRHDIVDVHYRFLSLSPGR